MKTVTFYSIYSQFAGKVNCATLADAEAIRAELIKRFPRSQVREPVEEHLATFEGFFKPLKETD